MTRAEVLTLTQSLDLARSDSDTLEALLDEIMRYLAMSNHPISIKSAIKALTSGTATYDFESDMLRLVAAFHVGNLLSETNVKELNTYAQTWSVDSGTPKAITQDEVTTHTYTLYPNPDTTSDPLIPIHGEPFGEDFPNNSLTLLYADKRDSNICEVYGLFLTFSTLAEEFIRPSNHTDSNFSNACTSLAILFQNLLEF